MILLYLLVNARKNQYLLSHVTPEIPVRGIRKDRFKTAGTQNLKVKSSCSSAKIALASKGRQFHKLLNNMLLLEWRWNIWEWDIRETVREGHA